jgi:hypothetical protein
MVINSNICVANLEPLQHYGTSGIEALLLGGLSLESSTWKSTDAVNRTCALLFPLVGDLFPSLDLVRLAARLCVMTMKPDVLVQVRYRFLLAHTCSVYQTVYIRSSHLETIENRLVSEFRQEQPALRWAPLNNTRAPSDTESSPGRPSVHLGTYRSETDPRSCGRFPGGWSSGVPHA